MALREMLNSRTLGRDFRNSRKAVRVFQVDASTEDAALGHPDLPQYNSAYPSDNGLYLDLLEAAPVDGFNVYQVTATYSSDRSSRFANFPNKDQPGFYRLYGGLTDLEIEVPTFITVPMKVSHGDQSQTIQVYEAHVLKSVQRVAQMNVEVVLPTLNITQLNSIGQQVNRIHLISNLYYAFIGANISEKDALTQTVTYNWLLDPGSWTPSPGPAGTYVPTLPRPQYCMWVGLPAVYPTPPSFPIPWKDPKYDFRFPDSWQTLPGMPLL